MIVDLSKIPEGKKFVLSGPHINGYYACSIGDLGWYGSTPQEAVDNAIREFEG
jgi:hypothetical protein